MDKREPQPTDEATSQIFIVRIWSELRERPELPIEARGVIEHVPSGRRQYFRQLGEILSFIKTTLVCQGLDMEIEQSFAQSFAQRFLQWFGQWLRRLRS